MFYFNLSLKVIKYFFKYLYACRIAVVNDVK